MNARGGGVLFYYCRTVFGVHSGDMCRAVTTCRFSPRAPNDCVLLHRGYPVPFLPVCRKAEEGQVGELNWHGFSAGGALVCGAGALSLRTASIPGVRAMAMAAACGGEFTVADGEPCLGERQAGPDLIRRRAEPAAG